MATENVGLEPCRCSNCGRDLTKGSSVIAGNGVEDGEAFCSNACLDQHDKLGCPHETGEGYRTMATAPEYMSLSQAAKIWGVDKLNTARQAVLDEQIKHGETLRDLPGDTLEKAMAICDLWLHRFEGKPNETIPAHVLAADAVKDIRDGIAALKQD